MVYVTFNFNSLLKGKMKFAIECANADEARQVAYDVSSLAGLKYVRIMRKGTPKPDVKVYKSINEIFS